MPPTHLPFKNWSRHPPCIASLLRYGAPSDLEKGEVNDLLAAYVVAKGLSDTEGEKLVQKIAQRSVLINGTSVTTMQMTTETQLLQQFRDHLTAAS